MKIYKYQLEIEDMQNIKMCKVVKFLNVKVVDDRITFWALVDENTIERVYTFALIGTGNPILDDPYEMNYIGTVLLNSWVWHVFYF